MSDPPFLGRSGVPDAPQASQIVGGLFVVALFTWGLAFYGLGFYLVELEALHGWSLTTLSNLTLLFLLSATAFGFGVGAALQRTNGRPVFVVGAIAMSTAMLGISLAETLWQVAAAYLVMAVGWASLSMNPISATVVAWYGDRSSTPLTIALTGASAGGICVLPLMVWSADEFGFRSTLQMAAVIQLLVVGALALLLLRTPNPSAVDRPKGAAAWTLLGEPRFWLVTLGLSVAIAVQVGFLVHHLNLLTETVAEGKAANIVVLTTGAALIGRLLFIVLSGRFGPERTGLGFVALEAVAFVALGSVQHSGLTLTIGSIVFGLGVGVLITLPALFTRSTFIDHDFPAAFPLVNAGYQLGVALGAPMLAALHGGLGGYRPALVAMGSIQLGALGLLVLSERRRVELLAPTSGRSSHPTLLEREGRENGA